MDENETKYEALHRRLIELTSARKEAQLRRAANLACDDGFAAMSGNEVVSKEEFMKTEAQTN